MGAASLGITGLGSLLAGCGTDVPSGTGANSALDSLDLQGDLQLVKRYPSSSLVPGTVRLPVSLADTSGILGNDGKRAFPDALTASVVDSASGDVVVAGVSTPRRGDDQSVPYWAFLVEITSPGTYFLRLDGSRTAESAFQVDDASGVAQPIPGRALPPFDTPTVDDRRGVDPICTRGDGPCPFHAVTLSDALASGKPVVYLIGTPAHCKTGTCAPALDGMIATSEKVGERAVFVHADVYADEGATRIAPAVSAYKLGYEPVLYVTRGDGVVDTRLDAVFSGDEILDALARVGVS